MAAPRKCLLVVGETGDGKSTLIRDFVERSGGEMREAMPELPTDGVTKDINPYNAGMIGSYHVCFLDTPGVGDRDITVGKLVAKIEAFLEDFPGGVQGVLLCSNIAKLRVTLGARVVAKLAEKGFQGACKWDDFVLVGTQADRCNKREIQNFKVNVLASLNEECGGSIAKVACVSIDNEDTETGKGTDVSELEAAIEQLTGRGVQYQQPAPEVLANAIGEIMDVEPRIIEEEIVVYRKFSLEVFLKEKVWEDVIKGKIWEDFIKDKIWEQGIKEKIWEEGIKEKVWEDAIKDKVWDKGLKKAGSEIKDVFDKVGGWFR